MTEKRRENARKVHGEISAYQNDLMKNKIRGVTVKLGVWVYF